MLKRISYREPVYLTYRFLVMITLFLALAAGVWFTVVKPGMERVAASDERVITTLRQSGCQFIPFYTVDFVHSERGQQPPYLVDCNGKLLTRDLAIALVREREAGGGSIPMADVVQGARK